MSNDEYAKGWREGIEAAAKICEEEARESYDNGGFNAFNRAAKRILALHPSVAEGREDNSAPAMRGPV